MQILNKIFKILDQNDKKFIFLLFFIIVLTTLAELINLGSLVAISNLILNEEKFQNFINNSFFNKFFSNKSENFKVIFFIVAAVNILILRSFLLIFFFWVKNKFLFQFEVKLKNKIFSNYLNQNYNFFIKNDQSELIRNINTEVGNFRFISLQTTTQIIFDLLLILFISFTLIYIKPIETLSIIIIFTIILSIYYYTIRNKLKIWSEKRVETESKIIKNLYQAFLSIKEIIIYNKSKKILEKNYFDNFRLANINIINYFVAELPKHFLEFVGIFLILFYLYFIKLFHDKELNEIIFILTLFSISIYKLVPSFLRLINSVQTFKFGVPTINIIFNDLINLKKNLSYQDEKINIKLNSKIKILDLNLKLNNKYIYKSNLNLEINKNEKILILGPSGSGKTSLLLMLGGFQSPSIGKILIDDIDINKSLKSWQKNISWVDQKTVLFDDTVKNNITLFEDINEIDNEKLLKSIKNSNLSDLINENFLEKRVGENTKFISGGEAQRLSLARAYYHDRNLILLDEFTSNLDKKNVKEILENIRSVKNKTIICISHDEKLSQYFDRSFIIDK